MTRAVVEREDLLFAGYLVYRLWEVDEEGGHTRLRGTTTVRIANGQPDPPALAQARAILGELAGAYHLRVGTVPW
jgi:hypothetical protein